MLHEYVMAISFNLFQVFPVWFGKGLQYPGASATAAMEDELSGYRTQYFNGTKPNDVSTDSLTVNHKTVQSLQRQRTIPMWVHTPDQWV